MISMILSLFNSTQYNGINIPIPDSAIQLGVGKHSMLYCYAVY